MRQKLPRGTWYTVEAGYAWSGSGSVATSRGGGSVTSDGEVEVKFSFVVEEVHEDGQPKTVVIELERYHRNLCDLQTRDEDRKLRMVKRPGNLDPNDHPLTGHTLLLELKGKKAKLGDLGPIGKEWKKAKRVSGSKFPRLGPYFRDIFAPAWSKEAPEALKEGDTWKCAGVEFLRFAGKPTLDKPDGKSKKRQTKGDCALKVIQITKEVITIHFEVNLTGYFAGFPSTNLLKGTLALHRSEAHRIPCIKIEKALWQVPVSKSHGARANAQQDIHLKMVPVPK